MNARDELRDCFLSGSRDRFEAAADSYGASMLTLAADAMAAQCYADGENLLRSMAAALVSIGEDIPAGDESTLARQLAEAPACGRCHRPFDPSDTRWNGDARHGDTEFCRRCVDRCHDSEDASHRCPICQSPTEAGAPRD